MSYEFKCIQNLELLYCDPLISRLETWSFFIVTLELINIRDCITTTTIPWLRPRFQNPRQPWNPGNEYPISWMWPGPTVLSIIIVWIKSRVSNHGHNFVTAVRFGLLGFVFQNDWSVYLYIFVTGHMYWTETLIKSLSARREDKLSNLAAQD